VPAALQLIQALFPGLELQADSLLFLDFHHLLSQQNPSKGRDRRPAEQKIFSGFFKRDRQPPMDGPANPGLDTLRVIHHNENCAATLLFPVQDHPIRFRGRKEEAHISENGFIPQFLQHHDAIDRIPVFHLFSPIVHVQQCENERPVPVDVLYHFL
jgi:hypothetical protein